MLPELAAPMDLLDSVCVDGWMRHWHWVAASSGFAVGLMLDIVDIASCGNEEQEQ
jgi:hypothetical protein